MTSWTDERLAWGISDNGEAPLRGRFRLVDIVVVMADEDGQSPASKVSRYPGADILETTSASPSGTSTLPGPAQTGPDWQSPAQTGPYRQRPAQTSAGARRDKVIEAERLLQNLNKCDSFVGRRHEPSAVDERLDDVASGTIRGAISGTIRSNIRGNCASGGRSAMPQACTDMQKEGVDAGLLATDGIATQT
ncbi:hypothetical protein C6W89_02655 [Halomonas sp. SYSU XM8]|nr:hypothetical protein C6W89_02655 [Halomonas sp. SYSU XM8]